MPDTLAIDSTARDTLLRARINGREVYWSRTDTNASILREQFLDKVYLSVFGIRGAGDSREAIQIVLWDFVGVGVYPLRNDVGARGGVGSYAQGDSTWWSSYQDLSDSAWVTSYDSASGRIEGVFRFVVHRGPEDSVVVDSGAFRGVAKDWVPQQPDCVSDSLAGDCHTYDPTPCRGTVNPATSDTAFGAEVNGNPWVMSSRWANQWPYIETRTGPRYLTIGAGLRTDTLGATGERLQIWVYDFQGPGVYAMSQVPTEGRSYAYYECAPDPGYVPLGWAGDEVNVTSWDSVTGEVVGTFQFHASKTDGTGAAIRVTNGTFHLTVPTY